MFVVYHKGNTLSRVFLLQLNSLELAPPLICHLHSLLNVLGLLSIPVNPVVVGTWMG